MKGVDLIPRMEDIAQKLEAVGAQHAPLQRFTVSDPPYGREVCLSDPPGVYYLLGTGKRR